MHYDNICEYATESVTVLNNIRLMKLRLRNWQQIILNWIGLDCVDFNAPPDTGHFGRGLHSQSLDRY